MNVQIFGTNKSQDTKKALRFFKDRGLKPHFVDLNKRPIAPGELNKFIQKFGLNAVIDSEGKAYQKQGLEYMRVPDEQMIEKLIDDPALMVLDTRFAEQYARPIERSRDSGRLARLPDRTRLLDPPRGECFHHEAAQPRVVRRVHVHHHELLLLELVVHHRLAEEAGALVGREDLRVAGDLDDVGVLGHRPERHPGGPVVVEVDRGLVPEDVEHVVGEALDVVVRVGDVDICERQRGQRPLQFRRSR
jgi:arsenate reductase (glutaredoxin)